MPTFLNLLTNPVVLVALGGAGFKLVQRLYRRKRDEDIKNNFIYDMATNHLPHIYHTSTLICDKLGIEVTEPPKIQFVKLNDDK